jgi:hypothetical protein
MSNLVIPNVIVFRLKVHVHWYASYVSDASYETDLRIISIISYIHASTDRQRTDRTHRFVGYVDEIDRRGNFSDWCWWRHTDFATIMRMLLKKPTVASAIWLLPVQWTHYHNLIRFIRSDRYVQCVPMDAYLKSTIPFTAGRIIYIYVLYPLPQILVSIYW